MEHINMLLQDRPPSEWESRKEAITSEFETFLETHAERIEGVVGERDFIKNDETFFLDLIKQQHPVTKGSKKGKEKDHEPKKEVTRDQLYEFAEQNLRDVLIYRSTSLMQRKKGKPDGWSFSFLPPAVQKTRPEPWNKFLSTFGCTSEEELYQRIVFFGTQADPESWKKFLTDLKDYYQQPVPSDYQQLIDHIRELGKKMQES